MTKRGKLVGSIVVLLFIAIMVPVAIFALQRETIRSSNCVKFNVVDFQGDFYLALIGNKPNSRGAPTDIGSINDNSLTPAPLFTAKYDATDDAYNVYNIYNSAYKKSTNNTINFPDVNVEFDKNHYIITYYFVFVNTATNNALAGDNRDVLITPTIDKENIENITSQWSCTKGTTLENATSFDLTNKVWQDVSTNDGETITVKAREGNENDQNKQFNYVVLRFSMEVDPDLQTNIDSQFTITINLASAAVEE